MTNYTFRPDRPITDYRKSDTLFLVCSLLLWGLGIYTLYSCTPNVGSRFFGNKYYFVIRQLISSLLAFAGMFAMSVLPVKFIRKFVVALTFLSLVLCAFAFLPGIGDHRKGASRWITIPHVVTFQPSEIVKLTLVLYLSHIFDRHQNDYIENSKDQICPIIVLIVFVIVIFCQKDLSTGVLIMILGLSMFVVSGAKLIWLIPVALLAVPAIALMIVLEPFRLIRVLSYIRPEEFIHQAGYQNFASERAISAGGIWGVGSGTGLDVVSSIPEVQTDYIFAGWASSMGLLGVTAYFLLLAVFTWRGFRIAWTCPNRFAAYGSFGFTLAIFVQSLFNCAVVCGAVPTTGIPLPFFSSGGSSLIITMAMCGFIINASHCGADSDIEDENLKNEINSESFMDLVVEYE